MEVISKTTDAIKTTGKPHTLFISSCQAPILEKVILKETDLLFRKEIGLEELLNVCKQKKMFVGLEQSNQLLCLCIAREAFAAKVTLNKFTEVQKERLKKVI